MKYIGNFKEYIPEAQRIPGASYIINEFGEDWYSIAHDPERVSGKFYAATDEYGKVVSVTDDGTLFFPKNFSAWEVEKDKAPANFLTEGDNATIIDGVYSVDYVKSAEAQKTILLSEATATIGPLQDAVDLGMATDEENVQLKAWKKYRVLVNRVNPSKAPKIVWPQVP
jgi:hypothetical protein